MRVRNKMEKQNKINTPKKETIFLLKFILLLLSVSFLINSCKNEEFLDENETGKQSINSKKIPFDNSIHFPTINKNITKINAQLKKINNQKNSDNSTVEILTDEVLFTSYANTHTYTFILIRDNPEYWLENVVLHYNTETNNYNEYLIQYSFGENELLDISNGELFENSEYVNVISLENGFFNQNQKSGCDWTSETVWSDCGSGVHNQSNIGEWHNCTANPPPSAYQQWSMTCTSTNETIDADPSSGGGGENTSGGGGSNDNVVSNPLTNPPCTIGQGNLGIVDSNGGCVKPNIDDGDDDECYDVVENISQGININLANLDNSELQNTIEQPINVMTSERLLKDKFQATAKYFQNLNPSNSTLASNSPLAETSQMLAEVSNSEDLSIDDLLFMWNKTKEVFDILSPHSLQISTLGDIDNLNQILTASEIQTVETNLLIVSAFSSLKQMFNDHWPQNAEEWSEFGEFIVTVLKELVPELIPGVAEILAIKNAINDFNSGDYTSGSTELGLALIGVFPAGKLIKVIAKFAKGFRIVVRLTKSYRKAKKMTQAISGSLDDALVHWNKLGCKGNNKRVRVLNNASEAQGKSYFDLLTKNGVDITPPSAPSGLIVKQMPDGSAITFRTNSTYSPNTNATIDFNGGNYDSNLIKELKFND